MAVKDSNYSLISFFSRLKKPRLRILQIVVFYIVDIFIEISTNLLSITFNNGRLNRSILISVITTLMLIAFI